MKQKNNITLLVIGVLTLLGTIVGAAYAYFSSSITPGSGLNLDVEAQANTAQFTASGGEFGFTVTGAEMQQSQAGSLAKEATGSIDITLSAKREAVCTFDVMYEWKSGSSYTATSGRGSQFEFGVLYEGSAYGATNNAKSPVNFDTLLSTYNGVVLKGAKVAILDADGTNKTTNITLNFKVQMYNLNHDQSALAGTSSKSYSGRFYVTNVDCLENRLYLSDAVLAMESNGDYISSQYQTIYRVVNQNGVRYEGADPDNYVYYNCTDESNPSTCEKWRIIGTFDGSEIGLTAGKKYTKIVRGETLDDPIDWNVSGENDWVNSSLNAYLNGTYLNSLSSTAQSMIAKENDTYSKWYLLGPSLQEYENLYSQDWYLYERNPDYGKTGYQDDVQYGALGETNAAVGLMYPSDWGYASYSKACNNELSRTLSDYDDDLNEYYEKCGSGANWLTYEDGYIWFISPASDDSKMVFHANGFDSGGFLASFSVDGGDSLSKVYPTLYLDDEVVITSGNGSSDSPFVIKDVLSSNNETPQKQTLSNLVISKESTEDYTSSQDQSIYRVVDQNGVRYEGKDPDNYVYYNCSNDSDVSTCERWRIIGTFDGAEMELTAGKKYTKIARSTPFETQMKWDEGGENDWENSSLNVYLNETYFASLSSTSQGMIAKENNKYSTWYLLGIEYPVYQEFRAQDWYLYERDTSYGKPGYKDGEQYGANGKTNAAIGLMYPSDYGYAAYGTNCNNESIHIGNYHIKCSEVDWLLYEESYEWLISPELSNNVSAFRIYSSSGGHVGAGGISYTGNVARPVLYLSADVSVAGGSGTYDSPYTLTLN